MHYLVPSLPNNLLYIDVRLKPFQVMSLVDSSCSCCHRATEGKQRHAKDSMKLFKIDVKHVLC